MILFLSFLSVLSTLALFLALCLAGSGTDLGSAYLMIMILRVVLSAIRMAPREVTRQALFLRGAAWNMEWVLCVTIGVFAFYHVLPVILPYARVVAGAMLLCYSAHLCLVLLTDEDTLSRLDAYGVWQTDIRLTTVGKITTARVPSLSLSAEGPCPRRALQNLARVVRAFKAQPQSDHGTSHAHGG